MAIVLAYRDCFMLQSQAAAEAVLYPGSVSRRALGAASGTNSTFQKDYP